MGARYQMTPMHAAFVDQSRTLTVVRPHLRSKSRRKLLIAALLLTSTGALALVARNALESHIRQSVIPSLSQRLGRSIEVGEIRFGLGTATMREIEVRGSEDAAGLPLVRVRQAKAEIDLRAIFRGEIVVEHIAVQGVAAQVRRDANGSDNISDLLRSLVADTKAAGSEGTPRKSSRLRMHEATLSAQDIQIRFEDLSTGSSLVLESDSLAIDVERAIDLSGVDLTAKLALRDQITAVELQSARIRVSPDREIKISSEQAKASSSDPRLGPLLAANSARHLYLERVRGQKGEWQVNLTGEFDGAESGQGEARMPSLGPESFVVIASSPDSESVELRVSTRNYQLSRVTPLLSRIVGLSVEQGVVSGDWNIHATRSILDASGEMNLEGVSFRNARLAKVPVEILPTQLRGSLHFDRTRGEFRLDDVLATSGKVPYRLSLETLLPGYEREDHVAPRIAASLQMPSVPCQDMLDSLPRGLAPELEGFALQGQTRGELRLQVDWSDLDASELETDVEMKECRVLRAPEHMSAERLSGSFEHRVPVPGGWRSFVIGPENSDFVALDKVSSHLKRSFLTTEDSAFYRHEGFITKEFRGALIKNLKRGRFAYGASSISMQVVKNVLLSREKTVSRKLQELFLTWHMEQALSKDRILEIYVNAIEFGPGLYGIRPASRQYFAKDPRHLNPVESAFLASLLPAPTKRYKQYCGGYVRRSTSAKIERILGFMHKRHRLDEEQYAAALETPLSFRGRRSTLCQQPTTHNEGKNS